MVIETKFNIGDEVYYVYSKCQKEPIKLTIERVEYMSDCSFPIRYDSVFSFNVEDYYYVGMKENDLFKTKEEAEKRLKELQEEK